MTPRVGEVHERSLARFHPETVIRELGDGETFKISDAVTHVGILGATGSGKSSGSGKFLATGYLGSAAEAGMLVLCPKPSDPGEWEHLCELTGRSKDVRLFDASGEHYRFNFLDWLAGHASDGAGLTSNVVAFLEEIITALEPEKSGSGGGENVFWEDSLHQLLVAAVELVQLAGYELGIPTMRDIVRAAPLSREEGKDPKWQAESACWFFLEKARERCKSLDEDTQADYAECRAYWLDDFANLSEKTRSVITLMFTKLAQHFTSRPLRKLFCTDTTIRPEDTFDGAVIIVALPTQEYRTVGRIAALTWKYAWQLAVLRRKPAPEGEYLRPVCCWADEAADNFLSRGDLVFAAAARSSAGALCYLVQNVNQYRKRLGGDDAFEAFISNLQTVFVHQSTGPTCRWMSERLGEVWVKVTSINTGQSGVGSTGRSMTSPSTTNSGVSVSEQRRFLIEPAAFTTLKRGGPACGLEVEAILYKGGHLFNDGLPFKRMRFLQR
jgi:type IV secretory pathway TraG/TraD family ATPase VirD4